MRTEQGEFSWRLTVGNSRHLFYLVVQYLCQVLVFQVLLSRSFQYQSRGEGFPAGTLEVSLVRDEE